MLVADAEGASKEIAIDVSGAADEDDAVEVGRAVARSNLLKCALHGEDPNWGRVLAAVGTTAAAFDPTISPSRSTACGCAATAPPARTVRLVDLSPVATSSSPSTSGRERHARRSGPTT